MILRKAINKLQLYPCLFIAIAVITGIVTGNCLSDAIPYYIWIIMMALSVVLALVFKERSLVSDLMLFLGFVSASAYIMTNKIRRSEVMFPESYVVYNGVIASTPEMKKNTVRFDMIVNIQGQTRKFKASIMRDANSESLKVGDCIYARSILKKPENYKGSTFDYRRYLVLHDYSGTTMVWKGNWNKTQNSYNHLPRLTRIKLLALKLRSKLLSRFNENNAYGQDYAVLAAMVLGDKSYISKEVSEEYSISGASHVLALSGLHLGIIYAVLSFLFSARRFPAVSQVFILSAIWVYVFIVGMSVSVMRSAVMISIYAIISILRRNSISLNSLSIAAIVLLLLNPYSLYDVGFQMSFIAVLSIVVLYRPLYSIVPVSFHKIMPVRWLLQLSFVSIAAQIGVAPIIALYFGRFSCYFLLANIFVIPLSTAILYGAVLLLMTCWLPSVSSVIVNGLLYLSGVLNSCVSFVSSLPFSSIEGIHITGISVILYYIMVICIFLICHYIRIIIRFRSNINRY